METAQAKWKIKLERFGVVSVARPGRFRHFVFPQERRCSCQGFRSSEKAHPGNGKCVHLSAALAFLAACERAQREREAAARRKARGVSAWAFDFLFA